MKLYLFLTAFFLSFAHLNSEDIDVTQPLRITQLMPRERLFISLAVEPAIPKDFIALSKKGEIDYLDWVYWGPEEVLKAYFKDPLSLSVPIIRVKLTADVAQNKYGSFDVKFLEKQMSQAFKEASFDSGKWGTYPHFQVSFDGDEKVRMAYVGLNDEGGAVLLFHLIIPKKPTAQASAIKLWDEFLQKTKELPEPLFFKAQGQEMHPGYTIVNIVGREIKVTAEKRKSDQKIQFTVIPQDQTIEFKFGKAFTTTMGANWHHHEPLVKIEGAYIIDKGWVHYSTTTSVLIKEVDEFSPTSLKKNVFLKEL